jgi:hypothetical protein
MKKNPIKKIDKVATNIAVIKLMNDTYEVELNVLQPDDDILLEACTRLLENHIKNNNLNVSPFMEAKLKNEEETHLYNTYKVLINGAFHKYAENLRTSFLHVWNVDLSQEPIRSKEIWKTKTKTLY